jgi:hypothetical protein
MSRQGWPVPSKPAAGLSELDPEPEPEADDADRA